MRKNLVITMLVLGTLAFGAGIIHAGPYGMFGPQAAQALSVTSVIPAQAGWIEVVGSWYWTELGSGSGALVKYPASARSTVHAAVAASTNLYLHVDASCTNGGVGKLNGRTITVSDWIVVIDNTASTTIQPQLRDISSLDTVLNGAIRLGLTDACTTATNGPVYHIASEDIISQTLTTKVREYCPAFAYGLPEMPLAFTLTTTGTATEVTGTYEVHR